MGGICDCVEYVKNVPEVEVIKDEVEVIKEEMKK